MVLYKEDLLVVVNFAINCIGKPCVVVFFQIVCLVKITGGSELMRMIIGKLRSQINLDFF